MGDAASRYISVDARPKCVSIEILECSSAVDKTNTVHQIEFVAPLPTHCCTAEGNDENACEKWQIMQE